MLDINLFGLLITCREAIGAMTDDAKLFHIGRPPLGRIGTPSDIDRIAVFLASENAAWITGEVIAGSGDLQ